MNILFLSLARFEDINVKDIYSDLMRELISRGNDVYIVSPTERRYRKSTHIIKFNHCEILKVKTLNIQKTNIIEKGIGQLLLESQFYKAINKHWRDVKFDLIVYATPPITFNKIIKFVKKKHGAKSYLMLKDIFPQNAVDLGMMKQGSILHDFFKKKEKVLYEISDKIGTMSPANSEFIINHNPFVSKEKVEICPNSIEITPSVKISEEEKNSICENLGIPKDKIIAIYGGNLGKPQAIDFIIKTLKENEKEKDSFILIVGSGTEFPKIKKWFDDNNPINSKLIPGLPKEDYDKVIKIADIGLIFLDHRFTIPNYPSRILSYMENSQPVICATDPNTDIGKIAEKEGYGLWCESNDIDSFMKNLRKLVDDKDLRNEMGKKGRAFLEKEYSAEKAADTILSFARK